MTSLTGTTAVVTGAGRGFGRAVAEALTGAGARVIGVGRDAATLAAAAREVGFVPVPGDAADPALAAAILGEYRPTTVVLNAGAAPVMRPLHEQDWASFSRNWEVDVQQAFHWTGEALRRPLAAGSTVIAFSSGAALRGSPLSGGYAGAKSTIRFVTGYAAEESARAGLGLRFTCVLPRLTPHTDLGAEAVAAYAHRAGVDVPAFLQSFGPVPTPGTTAADILTLATDPGYDRPAYLLRPEGGLVEAP